MAEPARKSETIRYDEDFHAWSEEQSRLLAGRNTRGLDWENLAEEIRTLGGSERSEIRSRMIVLLQHLLKWQFQPSSRKLGWKATIMEARDQIGQRIEESPSLRSYPALVVGKQYGIARLRAADETGLPLEVFPVVCPYSMAEMLDESFFPGEEP
jgi:hypothetical protein